MYCVLVRFRVKHGFEVPFLEKMVDNASTSLQSEPGCRIFDVCVGQASGEVLLYEVYDHEAAFHQHLAMQHFKQFDADTAAWVQDKQVEIFQRILPGTPRH